MMRFTKDFFKTIYQSRVSPPTPWGHPPGTLKRNKNLKPGKKLVKCTSNCLLTQRNKKLKGTKQEPKSKSLESPKVQLISE